MIAVAALSLALGISSVVLALALRDVERPRVPRQLRTIFARRRDAQLGARSLAVLRATQAALRAGVPLAPALRSAAGSLGHVADDPFIRIARSIELNGELAQAARFDRPGAADRRLSVALDGLWLAASERLPTSRAAQLLGGVADRIAYETRLREEVSARTSGLRGQVVLLALLVPALTLYLLVTLPGLADTLATPLCRFVLVPLAIVLELVGIAASRAVVRNIA